ncbi:hypothetical protein L209DRAFT_472628 [Thermothelomyces heterothallicus CBS 203.75]
MRYWVWDTSRVASGHTLTLGAPVSARPCIFVIMSCSGPTPSMSHGGLGYLMWLLIIFSRCSKFNLRRFDEHTRLFA